MVDLTLDEAAELSAAGWARAPGRAGWWRDPAGEDFPPARALEVARRDARRESAPTFRGLPVAVDGTRATITLPGYDLASYRAFLDVKAALPRVEVDAAARTLSCHVADLPRLGVDARALAGGWVDDGTALYPDQRYVLDVALRRRRFAVFARCGWGKTVVLLAWARAVAARTGKPVLLVVPLSVLRQTSAEHARFWPGWPLPANLRDVSGGLDAWLSDPGASGVGVVNTDAFRRPRDLSRLGGVVLDESSSIKQAGGTLWKNVTASFRGVEYRLFCTATPAPNEVREYAAQALGVGAIDSHKEFFADFFDNAENMGWRLRPHARAAFYGFMSSWSIWIRDPSTYGFPARCAPIPAPSFVDLEVALTPEQECEARAIRAAHARKGQASLFCEDVGVATQTKLSQVSRGFVYEGDAVRSVPSRKADAVADAVARHARAGERAVVWVQFNEESRLITEALAARGMRAFEVTADTDDAAQFAAVEDINNGALDVLVAKPSTMGFGVNLQGASVCVFSGITHSFEQDHQAFSRVYRDGQTRAVTCYYVVTPLEAGMLANVRAKRSAWTADAAEMERAYLGAMRADLETYRGAATQGAQRTMHGITPGDRAALSALRPWAGANDSTTEGRQDERAA